MVLLAGQWGMGDTSSFALHNGYGPNQPLSGLCEEDEIALLPLKSQVSNLFSFREKTHQTLFRNKKHPRDIY